MQQQKDFSAKSRIIGKIITKSTVLKNKLVVKEQIILHDYGTVKLGDSKLPPLELVNVTVYYGLIAVLLLW